MIFASDLVSLVNVSRPAESRGNVGSKDVWTTVGTDVSCRFATPTAMDVEKYGVPGVSYSHKLFFMPTADVRNDDRLHFGAKVLAELVVIDPHEMHEMLIVMAKEIR